MSGGRWNEDSIELVKFNDSSKELIYFRDKLEKGVL